LGSESHPRMGGKMKLSKGGEELHEAHWVNRKNERVKNGGKKVIISNHSPTLMPCPLSEGRRKERERRRGRKTWNFPEKGGGKKGEKKGGRRGGRSIRYSPLCTARPP